VRLADPAARLPDGHHQLTPAFLVDLGKFDIDVDVKVSKIAEEREGKGEGR
jgi:hypothetical protein